MSEARLRIELAGYGPDSRVTRPYAQAFEKEVAALNLDPAWVEWWERCAGGDLSLYFMLFFDVAEKPSVKRRKDWVEVVVTRPEGEVPRERSEFPAAIAADLASGLAAVSARFRVAPPDSSGAVIVSGPEPEENPGPEESDDEIYLRLPLKAMSGHRADAIVVKIHESLEGIADCDDFEEENDEWVMAISGAIDSIIEPLRGLAGRARSPLAHAYLVVQGSDVHVAPRHVPLLSSSEV